MDKAGTQDADSSGTHDDDTHSPPAEDAKSSPPPRAADTKSSPPPPDSSSTPPPTSSPPPPDSSPPPPTPSPPPPKSESPPPQKVDKPSPPPQKEESPASPPPAKEESSPLAPPQKEKTSPSPPPPVKTPSPEKSQEKPLATPLPASLSPPPSVGTPPAAIVLQSPPPLVQQSAAALSPPAPAAKLTLPPRSGSGSSNVPPPPSSSFSVNAGVIAGVVVVGVGLLAAVIICLVCAVRKKKKQYYMDAPGNGKGDYYGTSKWNTQQNLHQSPSLMGAPTNGFSNWSPQGPPGPFSGEHNSGFSCPQGTQMGASPNLGLNQSSFSYEELARATNGFAQENVLGQGGFGYVHKGVLPNGKEVAVKSLKSGSGQGDREFQAEVDIISRVHHRHLVSLVGYCVDDGQRMLVYEFVPNKTLEFHLHGKGQPVMQWSTRMRIAMGAAKGLAYLHEDCHPKIIHRDIKAANILLDYNFEAMVADFGLAKLTSDTNTHVSTRVMGTFGYMAPEYASSGKLTDKSDVFSFGVMLLELITGRRPIDQTNQTMEDSLVDWARPLLGRVLEDGTYGELVDPLLENNFEPHEMDRMISCASASVRHSAKRRPKMIQIVRSLEGDQSSLNDTAIKSGNTTESGSYDTTTYNADMMKFKKMVMTSNYGSGEFEQTSDYGHQHHPSSSSNDLGSREFGNSGPQR